MNKTKVEVIDYNAQEKNNKECVQKLKWSIKNCDFHEEILDARIHPDGPKIAVEVACKRGNDQNMVDVLTIED